MVAVVVFGGVTVGAVAGDLRAERRGAQCENDWGDGSDVISDEDS